jgi:hypothetical protein
MTTQTWITGTEIDWSQGVGWVSGVVPNSTDDAVVNDSTATVNGSGDPFNYSAALAGAAPLSAYVITQTGNTVSVNGADTDQPTIPFTFSWGNGATSQGFFPLTYTYSNANQNYIITVTSHETNGSSYTCEVPVIFTTPVISYTVDTTLTPVSFPQSLITLQGEFGFSVPNTTGWQPITNFGPDGESAIEYVFSVVANVAFQMDNSVENMLKALAPASTMVEVCKMTSPEYLIEINAIAVIDE